MHSRLLLVVLAAGAMSAASYAMADEPTQPAASAAASTAAAPAKPSARDPNEVVCKTIEVIGTRLGGGRICKTRAEWAQTRRDAHDAVDGAQRNSLQSNPKGG